MFNKTVYLPIAVFVLCLSVTSSLSAELTLAPHCKVQFDTRKEATAAIIADDAFTQNLSRFDLQSRMQTEAAVSRGEWETFVGEQTLDWSDDTHARATEIIDSLRDRLKDFRLPLPETIHLALTTGTEESGAAYCRDTHIILPEHVLQRDRDGLESLLLHELFHVISTHNPQLRANLYQLVGFTLSEPIAIHASLAERRITNPDAPLSNCVMRIADKGRDFHVAPVLYASTPYAMKSKRGLFGYLTFRLMVVQRKGEGWWAVDHDGRAVVIDPKASGDYLNKLGKNTNYIVHPEEVLADNFVHLILKHQDIPSPRIPEKMREILADR